ncbi:MAG TPA: beta-ketoacyl synthase N-terminal-like domain-containing protein, partial [Polyangiales bacterium]|nr:beta-ketoacyl synthase N-terminal-like domain-containing protein [Polyangiales bacterium]
MFDSRAWLRSALSALMHVQPQDVDFGVRFRELGLESAALLKLVAELCRATGRVIPATAPWKHPTPDALADYVAQRMQQQADDALDGAAGTEALHISEPIAVVGMSCRLPGAVDSPEAFWALLLEGGDGIREVPADRWM